MNDQDAKDHSTLISGAVRTSFFHQCFTLIARASFAFAILLIILLTTSFWLPVDAEYLGSAAVIVSLILTHFILVVLENNFVAWLISPMRKGKPAVVYQRWLTIEDKALVFGIYRLLFGAIDSVSVSQFGNLVFASRALCGPPLPGKKWDNNPASKVLKVPFAAIDLQTQKQFIALLEAKCPGVEIAPSLAAVTNKPLLKSVNYIYLFTMFVFLVVLFDVGYSTFRYVELLKRYYLSDRAAVSGDIPAAKKMYESGEQLRLDMPFFSMVSRQLFSKGQSLSVVEEARSRALWDLGEKENALAVQDEAVKLMPRSYKTILRQVRLNAALGREEKAKTILDGLMDKHKHGLLPRLYLASLYWQNNNPDQARSTLKKYLDMLDEDYFSPPPVWPSSGEEVLHELFYRDDLRFIFPDKLLSPKSQAPSHS